MRRLTPEQKIRNAILRRRRNADRNARRRAEANGAKAVVDVSIDAIRARDNQHCHLCGLWVSVHDATLDHLVPLSRGGDHMPENIKLAHRWCNSKKGARPLSEIDRASF